MPIYDYFCTSCQKNAVMMHDSEQVMEFCPYCDEPSLKRVYSNSNFNVSENKKVGHVVKSTIEEAKKELKEQKREARRDY